MTFSRAAAALLVTLAVAPAAVAADDGETAGLRFMREEEKLAHDLYVALAAGTGDRAFANIAVAEQRHEDAVLGLLAARGLADTSPSAAGRFADPALQRLYRTLLARARTSRTAALRVGALVEETDIADLRARARVSPDPAVKAVYTRLEAASWQHLRAFTRRLAMLGVTYRPTVLAPADVSAHLAP